MWAKRFGPTTTLDEVGQLPKLASASDRRSKEPQRAGLCAGLLAISLSSTICAEQFISPDAVHVSLSAKERIDIDSASGGLNVAQYSQTGTSTTANDVSQYGITWTFSQARPVGQFANGDWWVVGPVTITSISPEFTGSRNGWEANPIQRAGEQGLDSRLTGFSASRVPSLPRRFSADTSIIKGVSSAGGCASGPDHNSCLTTAAVLTVLGAIPPANSFRPPFYGAAKPLFNVSHLQTDLLPSLAPVVGAPTLSRVERRYQRVQVDYIGDWTGRYMHPSENYVWQDGQADVSEYGSEIASDSNQAALRLLLNDPIQAKLPAIINVVQAGIDIYGMHSGGVEWEPNGGHALGRKILAVYAAVLLDDQTMQDEISTAQYATYGDDGHVYYSTNRQTIDALTAGAFGPALYGKPCVKGAYEQNQADDTGSRDCRDPIGMIDGGFEPGGSYQECCVSQPIKGMSLAARLLPGGRTVWNYQATHDYADRWVHFGAWTQPDNWNYLDRTPSRNHSARHGTSRDSGDYGSSFVDNMWSTYRSVAE